MTGWISSIDAGDILTIRKAEEPETEAFFQVVSSQLIPVPSVEYWSINLDMLSSSEGFSPLDTADYFIGYSRRGETGPVGYPGEQGEPGMTSGLGFNWTFEASLSAFFPGEFQFNGQTLTLSSQVYRFDGVSIDVTPVLNLIEQGDLLLINNLSTPPQVVVLQVFYVGAGPSSFVFETDMVFSSSDGLNSGETYFIGIDKN